MSDDWNFRAFFVSPKPTVLVGTEINDEVDVCNAASVLFRRAFESEALLLCTN